MFSDLFTTNLAKIESEANLGQYAAWRLKRKNFLNILSHLPQDKSKKIFRSQRKSVLLKSQSQSLSSKLIKLVNHDLSKGDHMALFAAIESKTKRCGTEGVDIDAIVPLVVTNGNSIFFVIFFFLTHVTEFFG